MLVNSLFFCFLIGSALQGSLCDDNSTNYTDNSPTSIDDSANYTDSSANYTDNSPTYIDDSANYTDNSPNNTDNSPTYTDNSPNNTDSSSPSVYSSSSSGGVNADSSANYTDNSPNNTGSSNPSVYSSSSFGGVNADNSPNNTDNSAPNTDNSANYTDTYADNLGIETNVTDIDTNDTATATNATDTDTSYIASAPNNTAAQPSNTGCGSKKQDSKNDDKEYGNQNGDDCSSDEDTSFITVENVPQYKENVILDPKTAHPMLNLSADMKSVNLGNNSQELDNNTERFDSDPCVLGTTGYNSGKHYFQTSGNGGYLVGFAFSSVPRKGLLTLSSDAGIFAFPHSMGDSPDAVGSLLDCDQGQVLFYDVSTYSVIFNLRMPNGCSEEMKPFFFIGAGECIVS